MAETIYTLARPHVGGRVVGTLITDECWFESVATQPVATTEPVFNMGDACVMVRTEDGAEYLVRYED